MVFGRDLDKVIRCLGNEFYNEFENKALSTDEETNGGDTFTELMYLDDEGNVQYVNY